MQEGQNMSKRRVSTGDVRQENSECLKRGAEPTGTRMSTHGNSHGIMF